MSAFQRAIPAGLDATLQSDAFILAALCKITRSDGTVYGFTTHDRDLTVSGLTYLSLSAIVATAVRGELTTGVDGLDLTGLIQSGVVTEADLDAGLYDAAAIAFGWTNAENTADGVAQLISGTLGAVTITDGRYVAELRSLTQYLQQQLGQLYGPACRCPYLGDPATCKVTIASYRASYTVASVGDAWTITFGSNSNASTYYDNGKIEFTSGANAGLKRDVKRHVLTSGQAVLTIHEPFPYTVANGDAATLEAGCDHRIETCRSRFNNAVNFHGEPSIPGTDEVIKRGRKV